ncbi:hypothetical protein BYT27DRAFT_7082804, partial [Phlegmacium glaucopus]
TIAPPYYYCLNTGCQCHQQMMIKKCKVWKAVLFTAGCRAIPVHSLHLYCEYCKVNYHHNYHVYKGQRIYYDTVPDIIQVGEHQFAEQKLINLWISMMLLSWTLATNCTRIFNTAMTEDSTPEWQFSLSLTSDQVYDGFMLSFKQRRSHVGVTPERNRNSNPERTLASAYVLCRPAPKVS